MKPAISSRMRLAVLPGLVFATLSSLGTGQSSPPLDTVRVAGGLTQPLFVTAPPGDTNRLFIVEQGGFAATTGEIKVLDRTTGMVSPTVYLSVGPIDVGGEQGLLGLAFHPDFADNGFFYVNYTDVNGPTTVARYHADPPFMTSATADPLSAQVVIVIGEPGSEGHNGGWIGFGPDGYLYVARGDGGGSSNGQNLDSLRGKMLRLDVDGDDFPGDATRNYAIPHTNPFAGATPGADEIWHYGLRNPWRDSFDRASGDLWIGDVGLGAFEEIDFQPAGTGKLNFGWRCMEGTACTGLSGCTCDSPALTPPVHAYSHASGCSVTGGYVYRGSAICGLQGTYFFADYCSHRIWSFRTMGGSVTQLTDRTAELAPGGGLSIAFITSFGEDSGGEIYLCDQGGEIYQIVPGTITDCNANGTHDGCDIDSGASSDVNANAIPDECEAATVQFCDPGQGGVRDCPCGNPPSAPYRGCDNFGSFTGGAALAGVGLPSLASDSLLLSASGENPHALTIFWTGRILASIPGAAHGAGVLCVSQLRRLYTGSAAGGAIARPGPGDPGVSVRSAAVGVPITAGQTRYYFTIYRDPHAATACGDTASTVNSSNAVAAPWAP